MAELTDIYRSGGSKDLRIQDFVGWNFVLMTDPDGGNPRRWSMPRTVANQVYRLALEHQERGLEPNFDVTIRAVQDSFGRRRFVVDKITGGVMEVVVKYDIQGHGWDTGNVALFGTRFVFPEIHEGQGSYMSEPVPATEPEVVQISRLPGITSVWSSCIGGKYDLVVRKGTAFTWEELSPRIVELLTLRHMRLDELATKS